MIVGAVALLLGVAAVIVLGVRRRRSGAAFAIVLLLALGSGVTLAGAGATPAQAACETARIVPPPATSTPTAEPTTTPTVEPTAEPTSEPTAEPTADPTAEPTAAPGTGQVDGHRVYVKIHNRGDRELFYQRIWDDQNNCVVATNPVDPVLTHYPEYGENFTLSFEAEAEDSCFLARSVLHWKLYVEGDSGYIEIKAYTGIGSHSECWSRGQTRLTCNTAGYDVDIDDHNSWQDITFH